MGWFVNMDNDIIRLAKWAQKLELDFYLLCNVQSYKLFIIFLVIVQLKLIKSNNIREKKSLYNKIDNITNATNPPLLCIPLPIVRREHISLNVLAKNII